MTDKPDDRTRQLITDQLKALDEALAACEVATKPFRAAESAIVEARELLLDHYSVEIAGHCESCGKLVFVGERGHRDDDGIVLCAEHSPTWDDAEKSWQSAEPEDDPDRHEAFTASFAAHLAAGGSRDDKLTHEL